MSDYTPTPEAVEAAARALWASWNPNGPAWGATSEEYREQARSEARAALTAAGPLIAAQALREFAAERYEAHLTDPDLPASEQPSPLASRYRLAADDLRDRANTIEKEADRG